MSKFVGFLFFIALLVPSFKLEAQNDTTLKQLSEMKGEIDRFLNSKALSIADAQGHIVLDKSAYDSLVSLVIEQQNALVNLKNTIAQLKDQNGVQSLVAKELKAKEEMLKNASKSASNGSKSSDGGKAKEQDPDINPADEDPNAMYFALGSSFLTEKSKVKVLKCFQNNYKSGSMIVVNGYADNYGTDKDNMVISQKRAEAIASFIKAELLIPASQIVVNFYGYSKPKCTSSNSEKCNALNRRVELIFR